MDRPKIVVLCGSTRFQDEYIEANRSETLNGNIVLSVGMFGHQEGIDMDGPVKKMLDELHLRKIDLADEVLVLNVCRLRCSKCQTWIENECYPACDCQEKKKLWEKREDYLEIPYIGESTRREIAYAELHGKPIRYLVEQ